MAIWYIPWWEDLPILPGPKIPMLLAGTKFSLSPTNCAGPTDSMNGELASSITEKNRCINACPLDCSIVFPLRYTFTSVVAIQRAVKNPSPKAFSSYMLKSGSKASSDGTAPLTGAFGLKMISSQSL